MHQIEREREMEENGREKLTIHDDRYGVGAGRCFFSSQGTVDVDDNV